MFQNRSKTTSSSSLVLGPCLFPWWWGEEHDEDAHARGKNVHRWGCVTIRLRHGIIQKANVTQKVLSNCQGQGDTSGEDWAEKHAWARKKPWIFFWLGLQIKWNCYFFYGVHSCVFSHLLFFICVFSSCCIYFLLCFIVYLTFMLFSYLFMSFLLLFLYFLMCFTYFLMYSGLHALRSWWKW